MSFKYNFSAVRGIQAKREYYITMIPINLLSKLFVNQDDYISPEFRAQRCINEYRIPEMKSYILDNLESYVFSALSASIDGDFKFIASEKNSNIGILEVDMHAVFLINDGQHRKTALEEALKENPEIGDETISVVFFKDEGLKRSQQMFADLNKHAVKSTMSLSTLYDNRDEFANIVKYVIDNNSFLNKYIDKEKDILGKNSLRLFTLANFLRANKKIVREYDDVNKTKEFLLNYWTILLHNIDEFKLLEEKLLYKKDLREDYILTLSVTLQIFGRLGKTFYDNHLDLEILKKIKKVDWTRSNPEWTNRIINEVGKILNSEDAIIKGTNLVKQKLGIKLTREEEVKENEI
ncbi:MAG TPA: DNA sulfur modification protein DndB [Gallicola sp.]|nr:DNA sulfur modification protein DndB [Gallicola sp.]